MTGHGLINKLAAYWLLYHCRGVGCIMYTNYLFPAFVMLFTSISVSSFFLESFFLLFCHQFFFPCRVFFGGFLCPILLILSANCGYLFFLKIRKTFLIKTITQPVG